MPLLGLLPVVAAVLASEGVFSGLGGQPSASAPAAKPTAASAAAAPVATQAAPAKTTLPPVASGQSAQQTTAGQPAAAQTAPTPASAGQRPTVQSSVTSNPQTTPSAGSNGPFRAYRVQPGDTVRFVAEMFGVSPASVAQASGLQNPDLLRVGQVLTIPNQPGWLYRVQTGETLDQIAARSGVSSETILSASSLIGDRVRAGDVILIPDKAAARTK